MILIDHFHRALQSSAPVRAALAAVIVVNNQHQVSAPSNPSDATISFIPVRVTA